MASARVLVEALVAVARGEAGAGLDHPEARALVEADGPTRDEAVPLLAQAIRGGLVQGLLRSLGKAPPTPPLLLEALGALLAAAPALPQDALLAVLPVAPRLPAEAVLAAVEATVRREGWLTPSLEEALGRLAPSLQPGPRRRLTELFERLGGEPPVERDAWGREVLPWLAAQAPEVTRAWRALLDHAAGARGHSRPSAGWTREAAAQVAALGADAVSARLQAWLEDLAVEPLPAARNQDLLVGLVWIAGGLADPALAHVLARLAARCFRKVPGVGAASVRLGNACFHALGAMPGGVGVAHLSALEGSVRQVASRRRLEASLDEAAARGSQSREDLEELAVPTFDLDASGRREVPVGTAAAVLAVDAAGRASLAWRKASGAVQHTPPAELKVAFAAEVAGQRRELERLQDCLAGQAGRLERLWLADRRLPLAALRARYLEHPVVGALGRRLLWQVGPHAVLWQDGRLAPPGGGTCPLAEDAEARLWHVLDAPGTEALLVWRDAAESLGLQQPFSQLWREVYRPLEPAAREDRRFQGQLVREVALRSASRQRGWRAPAQGYFDAGGGPTLALPRRALQVALEVEPVRHRDDRLFYTFLRVEALRFHRLAGGALEPEPLRLQEVPPLVFSEVLREVDQMVATASLAHEALPEARELPAAERAAFLEGAWGELGPLARTRAAVLARVLPRTTLRDRARVEERWLVVEGAGGERFRIHLGSGQARREADARPLALKVERRAREAVARVFLPFEGDSLLATILGKAFALAAP